MNIDEHVSRETPAVARDLIDADRLVMLERYADLLATRGVEWGLLGPREVPRLWERHLLNCAVMVDLLPADSSVADLGSGAGLPGLVLGIIRPDLRLTLVEPLERRVRFLESVVNELGLPHIEVVRGRAAALHGQRTFDVVTSRAVAGLDRLLEWSMPLVSATGVMLAMKGERAEAEVAESAELLAVWGASAPRVMELGTDVLETPTRVVVIAWADPQAARHDGLSPRASKPGSKSRSMGKKRTGATRRGETTTSRDGAPPRRGAKMSQQRRRTS